MTLDDKAPKIRPLSGPMDVPVFNIIIYISRAEGQVRARVANLPDLAFTASSEPMVLKQSITNVKEKLRAWKEADQPIPWLDPASPAVEGEEQRLVPVHL